jgi:hypothetical protein
MRNLVDTVLYNHCDPIYMMKVEKKEEQISCQHRLLARWEPKGGIKESDGKF